MASIFTIRQLGFDLAHVVAVFRKHVFCAYHQIAYACN
jgi:hypothetical protein